MMFRDVGTQCLLDTTYIGYFFQIAVHPLVGRNRKRNTFLDTFRMFLILFHYHPWHIQQRDVAHVVRLFTGFANPIGSRVVLTYMIRSQVLYIRKCQSGQRTKYEYITHNFKTRNIEILFDDEVEIIHDRFPIDAVQPLTDKEYYVRGCTALLDAVGQAINKIDNVQKHLPEKHRAGKVLFVITTDGLENSSTEFNYNDIKRMIEAKKECGWEFLFLGANIDAGKEAEKIGIERNRSVTYENDHDGVALNYEAVGRAVRGVTKSRTCSVELDDAWADDIAEYHENAGKR